MEKYPLISIIIPAYNRPDYLARCLASIRAQEYKNYEVIIIDDGSSEGLKEITGPSDKFIKNDINLGPAYSRNLGVIASKGEILLFIDSDVEMLPHSLVRLPEIFSSNPSIGGIGGAGSPDASGKDVEYFIGCLYNRLGQKITKRYYLSDKSVSSRLHDVDFVESAFLAIPRDIFYRLGGFDPYLKYMGEDRDLCLAIRGAGLRVVVSPFTRAIHFKAKVENRLRALDTDDRRIFYLSKYLEVAIKRGGLPGGFIWMIGNYKMSLRPAYFSKLFKKLCNFKESVKRKDTDYLASQELEKYLQVEMGEFLKKALPFKASFPLPAPSHPVFFITSRCNAACSHCFISGTAKHPCDIGGENIFQFVESMKRPVSLMLTGGEPFLRDDLDMVLCGLMKHNNIRSIRIATNGSLTERIESVCRNICKDYRKPLHLQVSIDGLEKTHDAIRGMPGCFKKAIETCERLKQIRQDNPRLTFTVSVSIMKSNLREIEDLIDYLQEKGFPSKVSLVRGNSFSTFNLPADILDKDYNPRQDVAASPEDLEKLLEKITKKHPSYFESSQKQKLKIMLDTLATKKRQLPCYAGYNDGVIYSDGSLALCEQLVSFGNLKDWGWDFIKAWNSQGAMRQRMKILSCACIHGCNIGTAIREKYSK